MEAEVKRLAPRALGRIQLPKPVRADTQSLLYPFEARFASFAVHYLRTATRVLWDLLAVKAERLEPLYEEVKAFVEARPPPWLTEGRARISVRVPDACDFPASGLQIRGTIKNAIIDGARAHGISASLEAEDPDVELLVRGQKRPLVLSIDLAGRSMHERGYRLEDGEAPLKETIAAQMLILSRWNPREEALIDPMAGGGTIPIEAALMGIGAPVWIAPRAPRADRLKALEGALDPPHPLFADAVPKVVANEIHTPSLEATRKNAARAGVERYVTVRHGDFRDMAKRSLGERGLVMANPPYGERMKSGRGRDSEALETVYADLADWCRSLGRGWRAAFIVGNDVFEEIFAMKPAMKKPIWNGPIRAWFLLYDL